MTCLSEHLQKPLKKKNSVLDALFVSFLTVCFNYHHNQILTLNFHQSKWLQKLNNLHNHCGLLVTTHPRLEVTPPPALTEPRAAPAPSWFQGQGALSPGVEIFKTELQAALTKNLPNIKTEVLAVKFGVNQNYYEHPV